MRTVVGVMLLAAALMAVGYLWGVWGTGHATPAPEPTPTPEGPAGAPALPGGEGRLTFADLLAFRAYPLLWAGPEVAGHPLAAALDAGGAVTLVYGGCRNARDGCTPALQIQVYPVCTQPPQGFLQVSGRWENLRGARALWTGDDGRDLWLFTGDVTVAVSAGDPTVAMPAVAAALRPLAWPDPAPPYPQLPAPAVPVCG
ncbi:MAG TPA: hypothetical protein VIO14_04810 [Dehalococcoidia bacterium]